MAVFKCKMCGATLEVAEGKSVSVCGYCDTPQTLPKLTDERKANLFDRASHFRRNNEFDKAMAIYEGILNEDKTDAESYWSLVLCRYGIEYVEDPATIKRVPTVNRAQYTSVFMDEDYKSAIKYADAEQKVVYEAEAKAIDDIQKGILEISQKEEPFDVFICYKETDANGRRTPDSVLATELYHELVKEGFKVFFSRITLEDKLGSAYEPYIFAALNSAKVMVVLGTKQEHFNAVWVKNEWSRYLALIKNGARKTLIPAYKDMDPYDLPDEFSHLQAQDMTKLGFMQDLVRGIRKIAGEPETTVVQTVAVPAMSEANNSNIIALLDRAFMALEDGEFARADEFCEQVLNIDARNAEAYVGKLMAEVHVTNRENLKNLALPFNNNKNFEKAVRFGGEGVADELNGYIKFIIERNEKNRLERLYTDAVNTMNGAKTEDTFIKAANIFKSVKGYKDSAELAKSCLEKAEILRKEDIYNKAKYYMDKIGTVGYYNEAISLFEKIRGWKDSNEQIEICKKQIEEINEKLAAKIAEQERLDKIAFAEAEKRRARFKKLTAIGIMAAGLVVVIAIIIGTVVIPSIKYNKALDLAESGEYEEAIALFLDIGDYKDSENKRLEIWDEVAVRETVSAGNNHTVALKSDGTVVAVGENDDGQCDVDGWTDIVAVSAGRYHTVGLNSDGTVVAVGENYDDQCDVEDWTDIVAVSAGGLHTVGLKSDGTVVAVGENFSGQCNIDDWRGIDSVSSGGSRTVGLKSDGTVVAVGYGDSSRCDVEDWTDIVAVSSGSVHTVGLKSDGTVVAVGDNATGRCDVNSWTNIKVPE